MSDKLLWIWLSTKIPHGSAYADLLMERFDQSAKDVYDASADDLSAIEGLSEQIKEALLNKDLSEATRIPRQSLMPVPMQATHCGAMQTTAATTSVLQRRCP